MRSGSGEHSDSSVTTAELAASAERTPERDAARVEQYLLVRGDNADAARATHAAIERHRTTQTHLAKCAARSQQWMQRRCDHTTGKVVTIAFVRRLMRSGDPEARRVAEDLIAYQRGDDFDAAG